MTSFVIVFYVFLDDCGMPAEFMSQLLHKTLYFQFKHPFLHEDFHIWFVLLDLPC